MSQIQQNTQKELHNQLVDIHEEEANLLVRDLEIRLLTPVKAISKGGYPVTYVVWEYLNPKFEIYGWKERKSPIFTDQSQMIIRHGPYEKDGLYRVTAQKDERGFWTWTCINKLDDSNASNDDDHGENISW